MDLNQSFSQFNRLNKDNLDNNKQFLMDNSKAFNKIVGEIMQTQIFTHDH